MVTEIQYRVLKWIAPAEPDPLTGAAYRHVSKLRSLFGEELFRKIQGRTVIDFGCGEGREVLEMAASGAERVIGIDVQTHLLERARRLAAEAGLDAVCEFATSTSAQADVIVSIDGFEHFLDPEAVLRTMDRLLAPTGEILISFGPTWYHPYGGHLFSFYPWIHLLFSEKALIRWRSDIRSDGATRFREVAGGLNQMTIGRFERIVARSPFRFAAFETIPIRRLKRLHNRLTREFTSAAVRCRLVRKER